MRSVDDKTKQMLRDGLIGSLKLVINGVDYTDKMVNVENVRVDKRLESNIGIVNISDVNVFLNDEDGSIEDVLNDDLYEAYLYLVVDGNEYLIFSGLSIPELMERKEGVLGIKLTSALKYREKTKVKEVISDSLLRPVRVDKLLGEIYTGGSIIDNALMDINGSEALVSFVDGIGSAQNGFANVEDRDVLVIKQQSDGAVEFVVGYGNRIEGYRLNIGSFDPVIGQVWSATIPVVASSIRLLAEVDNKIYIVYRGADYNLYFGYIDVDTQSWVGLYNKNGVDIDLVAFDVGREVFVFGIPYWQADGVKFDLYEVDNTGSELYLGYQMFGYGEYPERAVGIYNNGTGAFYYLVGTAWFCYRFVYTGAWGSVVKIENFGIGEGSGAYIYGGKTHIVGMYGYGFKEYVAEDGTIMDLSGIRWREYMEILSYVDNRAYASEVVLWGVSRDGYDGLWIARVSNGNINWIQYRDINRGGDLRFFYYPIFYWSELFFVGLMDLRLEDGNYIYRLGVGFVSLRRFLPWFVLSKKNYEESVRGLTEEIGIAGRYYIEFLGLDKVRAKKRDDVDVSVGSITQDDYVKNPKLIYGKLIRGVRINNKFNQVSGGEYLMGDCSVDRYTLKLKASFVVLDVGIMIGEWYMEQYGSANLYLEVETSNLIQFEELDVVDVVDPLNRIQTGVVVGSVWEYPGIYRLRVHIPHASIIADIPEVPGVDLSRPKWENVQVQRSTIGDGPYQQRVYRLSFNDVGAYPIIRLYAKAIVHRIGETGVNNGVDIYEIERELEERSGYKEVYFGLNCGKDDKVILQFKGFDKFGRLAGGYLYRDLTSGNIPLVDFVKKEDLTDDLRVKAVVDSSGGLVVGDGIIKKGVVPGSLEESIKNTIGLSDIYNPAFDDDDGDGIPDDWSISVNNCSWELSNDSFMGKNAIKITTLAGATGEAEIIQEGFVPINANNFKKFIAFGYKAISDTTFTAKFYVRIKEYDVNLNLVATQDYDIVELGASISGYEFLKRKLGVNLNTSTRYIKVGLYMSLSPSATSDLDVYISYFYIAEQPSTLVLDVDSNINMNGFSIWGLPNPSISSEASNKGYVDKLAFPDVVVEEGDNIANAFASLSGGETVLIKNGTYTINSTIQITVSGVKIICQPNVLFTGSATPMFSLRNSDIVWDGGVFDGSDGGNGIEIYGTYSGRIIQNAYFSGFTSGHYAIYLNASSAHATKIINNKFESCNEYAIYDANTGYGYLCVIQGNYFKDCYGAIYLKYQEIFTIVGNQFYHCGNKSTQRYVIYCYQPRMSAIYGNLFWQSYYTAIRLTGGSGIGNTIFGNVLLATGYPTSDNSGVYDIYINANTNNSIFGNALRPRNFAEGSIKLDSGCSGTFIGMNSFDCQNSKYILYNETDARIVESVETGTSLPTQYLYEGKLFYNTSDNKLYIRVGGGWKSVQFS